MYVCMCFQHMLYTRTYEAATYFQQLLLNLRF